MVIQIEFNLTKGCFDWIVIGNNLQNYNKSIRTVTVIIQNKFPRTMYHEKPGTGRLGL